MSDEKLRKSLSKSRKINYLTLVLWALTIFFAIDQWTSNRLMETKLESNQVISRTNEQVLLLEMRALAAVSAAETTEALAIADQATRLVDEIEKRNKYNEAYVRFLSEELDRCQASKKPPKVKPNHVI